MAVAASRPGSAPGEGSPAGAAERHTVRWLLAAIVVLGAALRFSTLNEQSFWFDEATTWGIVSHGLGHVLSTVPKSESTPPLYYVLLWAWAHLFGTGEVGLRSLSALSSTLTIPVAFLLGRQLASDRAGLLAALLTAVNPFLFWYAQEARSYSLLLLASALSLLALARAAQSPSSRRLLLWGLAAALALAVHYYAAVLIVSEAAWLGLTLHRRDCLTRAAAALALAPVVLVAAALAPLAIEQNDGRAGYIATQGGSLPYRITQLVKEDMIGQGQPLKALLTATAGAVVLYALVALAREGRQSERRAGGALLAIGAGGVLVAVLVGAVSTDYVNTRNLLPTWPALMLPVAIGLGVAGARRSGRLAVAALTVLSLFCIWNIVSDPRFQRTNWRGAADATQLAAAPRAIIADIQGEVPLASYLPRLRPYPAAGRPVREVDLIWVQHTGQWGPLSPIAPAPLAGFPAVTITRTSSYVVIRYRATRPQLETRASLNRIYPIAARALSLLQQP